MWTTTTNELGDFAFDLPNGVWTISLADERLNATSIEDLSVNRSATEIISTMEVFANPEAVEVEMHVYLNAARRLLRERYGGNACLHAQADRRKP